MAGWKKSDFGLLRLLLVMFFISGCSSDDSGDGGGVGDRVSPTYSGPPEISYCSLSSAQTYSPSYTITGTAKYTPRELTSEGLGHAATARPIRYAEVRITDSTGAVVQCAETDNTGAFSFTLPQSGETYTISVNARADNSQVVVSVLEQPENNNVYALTTLVVANSNKSVGELTAGVDGDVLAGAFNIYDMILMSNEYLRANVGSCSGTINNCADFTVAPKVSAYWELGFNPGSYFGSGGVSFYLPGYDRLFILGGLNGDHSSSDTDHFDNSVIIHEYGHFLEDNFSVTNSPGGRHSGNKIIDPRLALGEGWGNFFQAAVRSAYQSELGITATQARSYVDSLGDITAGAGNYGYYFAIDLEDPDTSCSTDPSLPGCDIPEMANEGNFREFSVARFFWDVIDSDTDSGNDTISGEFAQIWATLTTGNNYDNSNAAFRAMGYFHMIQGALDDGGGAPITDWSPLRDYSQHYHRADQTDYAKYVDDDNSCGTMSYSITPLDDENNGDGDDHIGNYTANSAWTDNFEFSTSHLLRNNDFYHFKHPGGALNLVLSYQTQSGNEADLDFYLYESSARFGDSSTMVSFSRADPATGALDTETETITLSNLAAGDYLINVYVYTQNSTVGGPTNYQITAGGNRICPANLP